MPDERVTDPHLDAVISALEAVPPATRRDFPHARPGRLKRARRTVLATVAGVLALGGIAAATTNLSERVDSAFSQSGWSSAGSGLEIQADQAHRVTRTVGPDGTPVELWVAPARATGIDGRLRALLSEPGLCSALVLHGAQPAPHAFGDADPASCRTNDDTSLFAREQGVPYRSPRGKRYEIVQGTAGDARMIEFVNVRDGRTVRVQPQHRWYIAFLPPDYADPTSNDWATKAYDAHGALIGTRNVDVNDTPQR